MKILKKIDNFLVKHYDLFMFIYFLILIFLNRKDLMRLASSVGFCLGYFWCRYEDKIISLFDKIIDFIMRKVFKK